MWPFDKKSSKIVTSKDLEDLLIASIYETAAGIEVTPNTALKCTPVLAAITVLAQALGQLPLKVYERKATGRNLVESHDIQDLFHLQPNEYQTGLDFKQTVQFNLGQWGNGFVKTTRLGGRVVEMHPLNSATVTPRRQDDYSILYDVRENGQTNTYTSDEIWHLRDFSTSGWLGESRIRLARDAIATAIAAERYGAAFFKNGAKAKGYFQMPEGKTLSDTAFDRLKQQLDESAGSPHSTPILEEGLAFSAASQSARDSQLTELRQFQVNEIARIWNVPPHIIQSLEKATWANIEHQGRQFVIYSMMPWLRNWEHSIAKYLLPKSERDRLFVEFNVDAFLRGDSEARAKLYASGIQWGWLSPNEARGKENLTPRDEGDEFLRPVNMVLAGEQEDDEEAA